MKRSSIAFVMFCLFAVSALAQSNNGWQLVRADYGSGNSWVDVTTRVRSLIQNNALNFTVSGATLVSDSQPGRNRSLRLQLKSANGQAKQVTYRDNQRVNLPISYASVRSTLRVLTATYGSGNRTFDETNRLNSQVHGNQLNLQVNNQNMGGDPAPNQSKTLNLEYSFNGQRQQALVREGDVLRLPYSNTVNGALLINRATYGSQNRRTDGLIV